MMLDWKALSGTGYTVSFISGVLAIGLENWLKKIPRRTAHFLNSLGMRSEGISYYWRLLGRL